MRFARTTTEVKPRQGDDLGTGEAEILVPRLGELVKATKTIEVFNISLDPIVTGTLVEVFHVDGHEVVRPIG
jgi:hypothetical protein